MIIDRCEVFVSNHGRNYVTLKVTTGDGAVGWGDATLNGRELAVSTYLTEYVTPVLLGRDASQIEDTWNYLTLGSYWRPGPVGMAAVSAVDMALWDIKAKAAGVPLYQLLGGASRTSIRAYAHAYGHSMQDLLESVHDSVTAGFTAIRIQPAIPGLTRVYGVPDSGTYEPAREGPVPVEEDWDSRRYLRHVPQVVEAVRGEFGADIDLLHDVHHRLAPIEAARLAKTLDPYDLFWLEDPTGHLDSAAYRLIRQHSVTPIATGETFTDWATYKPLVDEHLIDYVRSGVTHVGGITAARKLSDAAGAAGLRTGFHGPTDISPIGLAAALHLDLAIRNFGIQEYMQHAPSVDEAFPHTYNCSGGSFVLDSTPGLGVSFDEARAVNSPYRRSYLPVNRLKDGTVHEW